MTSLLDSIKAENYLGPTTGCNIAYVLSCMNKADQADLHAALADPTIQHTAIVRALKNRNLPIKPTAVARHRKKECCCEPR
jgi:hypothetical protein